MWGNPKPECGAGTVAGHVRKENVTKTPTGEYQVSVSLDRVRLY